MPYHSDPSERSISYNRHRGDWNVVLAPALSVWLKTLFEKGLTGRYSQRLSIS